MADHTPSPALRAARGDGALQSPVRVTVAAVLALAVWPLLGLSWDPSPGAERPPDPAPLVATDPSAAARVAASATGGRVLDVQTRFEDQREYYSVKVLLDDGHVKVVELAGAQPTHQADIGPDAAAEAEADALGTGAVHEDPAEGTIDNAGPIEAPPPPDLNEH